MSSVPYTAGLLTDLSYVIKIIKHLLIITLRTNWCFQDLFALEQKSTVIIITRCADSIHTHTIWSSHLKIMPLNVLKSHSQENQLLYKNTRLFFLIVEAWLKFLKTPEKEME